MLQRVATALGVSPDFLLGSPRKQKVEVRAIRSPAEAPPTNRPLVRRSNDPCAPHRETCSPVRRHASAQPRQRETRFRRRPEDRRNRETEGWATERTKPLIRNHPLCRSPAGRREWVGDGRAGPPPGSAEPDHHRTEGTLGGRGRAGLQRLFEIIEKGTNREALEAIRLAWEYRHGKPKQEAEVPGGTGGEEGGAGAWRLGGRRRSTLRG